MAAVPRITTIEEFEAFLRLPENEDRAFELIDGEIVEMPGALYSSIIAAEIIFLLLTYIRQNKLGGHISEGQGGYYIGDDLYAPDVAYTSAARLPDVPHAGFGRVPPDLAVEVVSPTDRESSLRIKIANYMAAGVVVWVVLPETRSVEIYAPGQPVLTRSADQIIDGGKVLPGFEVKVADFFPAS